MSSSATQAWGPLPALSFNHAKITQVMPSPGVSPLDEQQLVDRARAGDRAAFRELYERHASDVFRFAILPMVRNRALAEELLADTFVRALENIGKFQWRGRGVLPWLIRIGKNRCLDHLRRAGRVAAWPEGYEHDLPDATEELDAEWVVSSRDTARVLGERIAACMDELNPRYRTVLRLRLVEKRSREDAAKALDVTIGTLDVLLFRACKAFRKLYTQRYGTAEQDLERMTP